MPELQVTFDQTYPIQYANASWRVCHGHTCEWPIDGWLSDNDMLHIKAAQVGWLLEDPSSMETVIVWITEFRRVAQTSDATVIEQDKDIKMKAWLEGLVAEGLVWFSFFDKFRITLDGVQRLESLELAGVRCTPKEGISTG
ncbi:hypothetical protein SCP_0606380 [Sparassis crispa]|uniref:Uncharacterized protein n=1 Tax=Sparassis crispa TaxID=139825 RepID=A0A401GR65_9APHY|nr:hypothetical protein SCP_0606380 [Sparassis crispa]GBE84659.1 hypothetical protein SCP_0606380 [Sparassis crispa]